MKTRCGNFRIRDENNLVGIYDKTVEHLIIPESVTKISSMAFAGCSKLISIFIPKTVSCIQGNLFAGCNQLKDITVDADNLYYDSRNNCNAIIAKKSNYLIAGCGSTIIPADVTGIGQFAFAMQDGLKSITIPDGVESISECAFMDCVSLVDVKFSTKLKQIGFHAFDGCIGIADLLLPSGVGVIEESAFEGVQHIYYSGNTEGAPWGAWMIN